MKIGGYGSLTSSSSVRKGGFTPASSAFADFMALSEAEHAAPAASLNDVSALSELSNLLAMQEISEQDVQRRKMVQQGKNMLEVLERLRQQLLIGAVPLQVLQDLSRQLAVKKPFLADPALNELMDDIELRAAVELAKLERAQAEQQFLTQA